MVPDRHVLPVGEQGVVRVAEHLAHVAGVVLAGVKIGVIAHLNRHVHGDSGGWDKARCVEVCAIAQLGAVLGHQRLQALTQCHRRRLAELHQGVEHRRRQGVHRQAKVVEHAQGVQGAEVEDLIAQTHAGSGRPVGRRKDAERQVGKREIVAGGDVDPRGQGCVCHGAKLGQGVPNGIGSRMPNLRGDGI